MDRYSRQTIFPGIGREGQAKLARSSVVVIGCGALGTVASSAVARAGVGRLRIIDRDFIEYHNLQRQILFDEQDVQRHIPKAIAAERHLNRANSGIEVEGIVADVNHRNIERLIQGADVIVDGLDNLEGRYLINDVSLRHRIPWIYGAAVSSYGVTMNILPGHTPCIRCLFPTAPPSGQAETCDTAGVVSAAPFIIGSLQSAEALKIIIGSDSVSTELVSIDVWAGTFDRLKIGREPSPDCPACQARYEFLEGWSGVRTTSLCGQNAVQVTGAENAGLAFDQLAARLERVGEVAHNEFMLRFAVDGYEVVVFPDARAIVKGTGDEAVARGLYTKYIGA